MMRTKKWTAQIKGIRLAVFVMTVALMASCSTAKNAAAKKSLNTTTATGQRAGENLCGRTVRYTIEKMVFTNSGGSEKEDNAAFLMTLNPSDGKLTMLHLAKQVEKTEELKLVSYTLSADMKSGEAFYEIIESREQENGNTVVERTNLKVEAAKGVVQTSVSAEHRPGGVRMMITQWEVVN